MPTAILPALFLAVVWMAMAVTYEAPLSFVVVEELNQLTYLYRTAMESNPR